MVPIFSILHDEAAVGRTVDEYAAMVEGIPDLHFRRREAAEVRPEEEAVFFVVTGGTEGLILDAVRQRNGPVVLLAHPGQNSLPAALEVLARLGQTKRVGKVVYLTGDRRADHRELGRALRLAATRRRLGAARIGLIGEPSDWLAASSPDPRRVTEGWGPQVVRIAIDDLVQAYEEVAGGGPLPPVAAELKEAFVKGAREVREPSDEDLTRAAAVYAALRRLADVHRLDAMTVRCFDLVLKAGTTGCLALSALTDEGLIAGCEGDLPSTLTMMLLAYVSGGTPFMANPARVDRARGSLWLAHCTVGRSLLDDYTVRSHFESGLGVGIQGTLPLGPVTLARIGGGDLDRLYVAEGELTANGREEDLCRTQVQVKLDGGVDYFLRRPLGNHHVLVRGHWQEDLAAYAELIGVAMV